MGASATGRMAASIHARRASRPAPPGPAASPLVLLAPARARAQPQFVLASALRRVGFCSAGPRPATPRRRAAAASCTRSCARVGGGAGAASAALESAAPPPPPSPRVVPEPISAGWDPTQGDRRPGTSGTTPPSGSVPEAQRQPKGRRHGGTTPPNWAATQRLTG